MAPQKSDEREQEQELAKTKFREVEQLFLATCRMTPAERDDYLHRKGVSEATRVELAALFDCDEVRDDAFDDVLLFASRAARSGESAEVGFVASIAPGTVLGDYQIDSEVGRGGMAIVYRARQLKLNRTVALKVLCFPWITDAVRQRFQREATAGARLHHDNIVTVYDYGQQNELLFFAMELVEGQTLAEWLAEQRSNDDSGRREESSRASTCRYAEVCRWVADVASGLAHAHANGVIHRDIKPSNLIVTSEGRVKILDFGVAKLSREAGLTASGTLLGTPRYMSPEQLSPEGQEVDHRTDIYSLGAMMYELLTLQAPYGGDDYGQVISQIRETEPPPPRRWKSKIPRPLETICLKAMAEDPRDRYQDANELARDLRNWLAGRPIAAVRRGALDRLARSALARRNRPFVAMSALLLACAATIAWFLLKAEPEPQSDQTGPKQISFVYHEKITHTANDDYAFDPALSGDGRWLAYVSDEGSETGDINIRLQELSATSPDAAPIERIGKPIQLTTGRGAKIEPTLSRNGRLLAFCTTGADGGVYLMPLGEDGTPGEAIRIGNGGRGPRFSPDGQRIAWWVGPMSRQLGILGDSIWVASIDTDSTEAGLTNIRKPRQFCPEFAMASFPVWSPDSDHLLFKGVLPSTTASDRKVTDEPDWWVAPVRGGWLAKPLGITPLLAEAGVAWSNLCAPSCWTPRSHRVLFAGFSHSGLKLWSLPLSPTTLQAGERPHLLTAGGLHEFYPGTEFGGEGWERCCYTSGEFDYGVWSLPIDADQAVVKDGIVCVAPNNAMDMTPSVSSDGQRIVFESLRGGPFGVWLQEADAEVRPLTRGQSEKGFSVISQDGSRVAYWESPLRTSFDHGVSISESMVAVIDLNREDDPPRVVARDVGSPHHWYPSSPPRFILTVRHGQLGLVDAAPGSAASQTGAVPVVRRDGWWIDGGKFSPDGRWIAFSASPFGDTRRGRIFVAPFTMDQEVRAEDWLPILDESDPSDDGHLPDWSPSGEILYFLSDRDGSRCIWYQRLDPETKRPISAPQDLYHFHEYRLSPQLQHWDLFRFSVARDRIVLSLGNANGNVFVGRLEER